MDHMFIHHTLLYIDPGTGSMLFTVLIGLISAGVYALRGALVKLRFIFSGGRVDKSESTGSAIAMFSDGKQYWNVFEPVCDELERRGVDALFLTASADDPALERTYEHVTCEFAGEGNKAFARMNMLSADVVLATTPGLDVYQWKRSRDVKWYAHMLHAASDASMYRMFGLDFYDAVLLSGDFQVKQVRELEKLRNMPEKETAIVGLTFLDTMAERLREAGPAPEHPTTVLLAPSWGDSAIFARYGGTIIDKLLTSGYHVIVRPHPQSFKSEAELINGLMEKYPESDQLEWNRDNDNFEVLRRSDVLVSDFSGVIFDFALVFDKPVIYTPPAYDTAVYDACWLDEQPWTFSVLPTIGRELKLDGATDIRNLVEETLADPMLQIGRDAAREACWGNRGAAASAVVDYLLAKVAELHGEGEGSASEQEEYPIAS